MKWDRVRDFVAVGKVTGAHIYRAPIWEKQGWCVGFDVAPDVPTGGSPDLHTKRGELRVFKTLDAAADAVRDLGMGRAMVDLREDG